MRLQATKIWHHILSISLHFLVLMSLGFRLTADPDVAGHVLTDLKQWKAFSGDAAVGLSNDAEAITSPMLLIDTAGCGIEELQVI